MGRKKYNPQPVNKKFTQGAMLLSMFTLYEISDLWLLCLPVCKLANVSTCWSITNLTHAVRWIVSSGVSGAESMALCYTTKS